MMIVHIDEDAYYEYVREHLKERLPLAATAVCTVAILCVVALQIGFIDTTSQPAAVLPGVGPIVATSTSATTTPTAVPLYTYIEITDSCGPYFEGACVNLRSGPGETYPSVAKLRNGVVLKVKDSATDEAGGVWYRIEFATALLYPERVAGDLYVAADVAHLFLDDGDHRLGKGAHTSTTKRIVVDRSEEMLYAYDGDTLYMQEPISTGLEFTPTPRGTFTVFKMTPTRYMQGPIPGVSDQVYDLPGVPWDLYFTQDGAVIHGAYWHDHFGRPWSHGCVNLSPENAKKLYMWAEIGIKVTVRD